MQENSKIMSPMDVVASAEKQLRDLENAKNKKMADVLQEREYVLALKRTVLALVYAAGSSYRSVYPGGEGFVEGRIKSQDSIETKTRNEFTEILNEIEENPNIDQKQILEKISKIDFKDILAFSVITTVPPKKFRTGSDEVNSKLTALREELEASQVRLDEHEGFIKRKRGKFSELTKVLNDLKAKLSDLKSKDSNSTDDEVEKLIRNLEERMKVVEGEIIEAKADVEYGHSNLERTQNVYTSILRELQYRMSDYYVSNLEKFSNFKFLGTVPIRRPKQIIKPNFRATNTGFSVTFSDLNNPDDKCRIKFEAQGKGGLDYYDAEFSAAGAEYHEEQKTKDGMISKKTEMPDFTIIGKNLTDKLESRIRRKYEDLTSIEDLAEHLENENIKALYEELKKYEEKIKGEIENAEGVNSISRGAIKKKMNTAFTSAIENLIQREIEDITNEFIGDMADSPSFYDTIQRDDELREVYESEKKHISSENAKYSPEEIEHAAKVKLLYYRKEKEIEEYARTAIPTFFRANLPSDSKEEIMVYLYTPGESIYRYFANKLNGLKDENGKFKYEPQEQQKRALLKLTGLFEEDEGNFYTYNRETNSFESLER